MMTEFSFSVLYPFNNANVQPDLTKVRIISTAKKKEEENSWWKMDFGVYMLHDGRSRVVG